MYIYLNKPYERQSNDSMDRAFNNDTFSGPFTNQKVQVSATSDTTALKIYDEIVIQRAPDAPDCSDFPELNTDAYICTHLHEILPDAPPTTQELRDGLPDLVKPTSDYDLVFSEEFNETPGSEGCINPSEVMNLDAWNIGQVNSCDDTDADGTPCMHIANGAVTISLSSECSTGFDTKGKVHLRYGYIEMKYKLTIVDTVTSTGGCDRL